MTMRLKKKGCLKMLAKYFRRSSCIPQDVPRGHMAVYVGVGEWKRYVIKVGLINHPLFKTLLDQLLIDDHHDYPRQDFRLPSTPLRIPCSDSIFLTILNCAQRDFSHRFCF